MTAATLLPAPTAASALASALAAERPYLSRYARSRLRDDDLADDAVQDTLVAALGAMQGFDGRAALRTWLTSILHHKIGDLLRERRRASVVAETPSHADADGEPDDDRCAAEGIDARDPERTLAARQATRALDAGLRTLPLLSAQLFMLRAIDGVPSDEAAARLGLSPAQGAQLLYRTRERLLRTLQQQHLL